MLRNLLKTHSTFAKNEMYIWFKSGLLKRLPSKHCCTLPQKNICVPNVDTLLKPSLQIVNLSRNFAKKKKGSNKYSEPAEEDESDSDEEDVEEENITDGYSTITKNVPSLRLDSILKSGLGISKKKIEKEFYAGKIRVNGEKILKKSRECTVKDEIDLIKGFSPDNPKFLLVDRISILSCGKVSASDNFPLTLQVLKALAIENYQEPFSKTSTDEEA